jgi:cell division protein FtsQ
VALDPTLPRRRGARFPLVVRRPRMPWRALVAVTALAALAAGGWLWLRDSSLAAVRDVEVVGSTSSEAPRIRAALESAALDMTTLHVREDALRAAAAPFSSIADLRVTSDFPHKLTIEIVEHRPVAILDVGGRHIPAAASGLLLTGLSATGDDLPLIGMDEPPAGERVENSHTLRALAIAGAAPLPLRRLILRMWTGDRGMMLSLENGPDLIFGDASQARRKWVAAARVLADPSAAGATYLDLRVPERVAAGGVGPVPEPTPEPSASTAPQTNAQP